MQQAKVPSIFFDGKSSDQHERSVKPIYTLETTYYLNGDVKGGDHGEHECSDDHAAQMVLFAFLQNYHNWYDVIEYKLTAKADARVIAEGVSHGTPRFS